MNEKLNLWASIILLGVILTVIIIQWIFDISIDNDFLIMLSGILIASIGNYIVAIIQHRKKRIIKIDRPN